MTQAKMTRGCRAALAVIAMMMTAPAMAGAQTPEQTMTAAQIAPAATRQDLIKGAYEVIEAPELGALFVASTPSFAPGTPGYIDMLDAKTLAAIRRIELPRQAFALGMDHGRGTLFVGNTMNGSLTVLDARSGLVLDTIQLGKAEDQGFEHVRMVEVDQKSGRVFVSSPSDKGTMWIVDPAAGNAVTRIDDAGMWAAGLAYDGATGRVYVSGGGMNEVLVVDGATGDRVGTFSTGDTPEQTKEASKHFFVNLALDASGKRLFAADSNSGALYVFDTETGKVLAHVPTGLGTLDVAYSDAADQIFVTYRGASREEPNGTGGLVVLNGADYTPLARIPLPAHPNSVSIGDKGEALFVSIKAPMEKEHPLFRDGASDTIMRFDLTTLARAIKQGAN